MELLRIVAMSMILIYHFLVYCIYRFEWDRVEFRMWYPFLACGMNLFFLLSGYFKIRLSVKSVLNLLILILTFRILDVAVKCVTGGGTGSYVDLCSTVLRGWIDQYWFMKIYFILVMFSPMLNFILKRISLRQLRILMLLYTLYSVYSCYFGRNQGYTIWHAMYMYCMAHWLRVDEGLWASVSTYTLSVLTLLTLVLTSVVYGAISSLPVMNYNSPLMVAASVLFFMCFTRLHLQNGGVNRIAQAALGCYLLQESMMGDDIYVWQHEMAMSALPLVYKCGIFALCFVAFWMASYLITMLARWIGGGVTARGICCRRSITRYLE